MNKDYYFDYYKLEREHWWFVIRGKIIIERIQELLKNKSTEKLKILNVGIATGRTTELLSKLGEVTSVEYDEDCCQFVRQELNMSVIQGSILELPFDTESFDLVCAFDVIEHIEDHQTAVNELVRVCKIQGDIIVTVPAFMQLWSYHDVVNQHQRRYLMKELTDLFVSKQINLIYKTYFNSLLFIPIWGFRQVSRIIPKRWIRKKAGSDFTIVNNNSLINKLLYRIFDFERVLLRKLKFPLGVSILIVVSKK